MLIRIFFNYIGVNKILLTIFYDTCNKLWKILHPFALPTYLSSEDKYLLFWFSQHRNTGNAKKCHIFISRAFEKWQQNHLMQLRLYTTFQWAIDTWYLNFLCDHCSHSWFLHNIFNGHFDGVADGGVIMSNSPGHHNDSRLFRKLILVLPPISPTKQTSFLIGFLLGTRDTTMAAVQKSQRWSIKIPTMVTRLGIGNSCTGWIQIITAV